MKKVISIGVVGVILIVCVLLSLASCKTQLSGTYTMLGNNITSYTFVGDRFSLSVGEEVVLEGTYSVYYGNIIFRYESGGEKKFDYLTYAQTEDLSEIQIGEDRYIKAQ